MRVELAGCESQLLREIADKSMKRLNVAKTYALTVKRMIANGTIQETIHANATQRSAGMSTYQFAGNMEKK